MTEPFAYENLDLLFRRDGDGYRVMVTHAPGGADVPEQAFSVPFDDRDLENFVLKLGRSKGRVRRIDSPEVQGTKDIGGSLFDALFNRNLATCLGKSLDRCRQAGEGLRLRLNLTETPSLLNLPWEFLFDQSTNRFLSLSDETPIVRYLAVDHPASPLRTPLPLRVLVMVSSPDDDEYQDLDVEKETADLKRAVASLEESGHLFLDFIPARLPDLRGALVKNAYQVFHFIGHGGFDEGSRDGALVLEGEGGRAAITSGETLGAFLADHRPLRLAVLNACEGGRSANDDPYAGVAQTLIQQGVPAVVAMQFEITDRAAITFSESFYASLVLGLPVDVAVSEARKGIYAQHNATEWATPVLYLRSPDGVLFDLESAVPPLVQAKDLPLDVDTYDVGTAGDRSAGALPVPPDGADDDADTQSVDHGPDTGSVIQYPPQSQPILEPLHRTPTLLLLGFAMLAFGLLWFFQIRYFDSNNVQYLKAGHYARAFGWGLGAAAAYLGAYFVGRSATRGSSSSRLLLLGGVSLTVAALGSLMFAVGKYGSQSEGFLNFSLGLEILGILVVGFLCFVLAKKYRTLKVGRRRRSPYGPLILAGIGIWLLTAEIYLSFSWITDYSSTVAHACYALASVGLTALSGALVLTGIYRAGPVIRLLAAALALSVLALANIVFAYSLSHNAVIDSASVMCLSYICLAIVFFLSPLLTRPSRPSANEDRRLITRA